MEKDTSWQGLADDNLEEWFLNHLAESRARFGELLEVIVHFAEKNQPDKAEACAGLLQDALIKLSADEQLLLLLEKRAAWQSNPEEYAASCFNALDAFFKGRNPLPLYLAACGLKNGVQPQEALRRLLALHDLKPGKYCYEKTWGVGKVAGIDEFDGQIIVDFEKKKSHRLAFAYAGETVQPLDDDHFLALKLRDPQEFSRRVKDNPAEAVKAVLSQFGEMNLPHLRALMVALVMPEKEWSSFWSAARATLSCDPLVHLPVGRNEPIKILSVKKEFDEQWRHDFLALRDVDRILAEIESLFGHSPPQNLPIDLKTAVEDRLKFVTRGMGGEQHGIIIQALLFADAAGISPDLLLDVSAYGAPETLAAALNAIPARMIKPFLSCLEKNLPFFAKKPCGPACNAMRSIAGRLPQGGIASVASQGSAKIPRGLPRGASLPAADALAQILPRLTASPLNEAILHCRQTGNEKLLYERMRALLQEGALSADLIAWLGRNLQLANEANICQPAVLARAALTLLQQRLTAGRRKDAGQLLRQIFTDRDLLKQMLQPMDANQRLDFVRRFNALAGLPAADRMAVAAKIILLFPEVAGAFSAPSIPTAAPKLTSHRSYRAMRSKLEKIIKEEIPHNSNEIGLARSYGDLRENYEYKAAKERQGLLLRRKAEFEQMLSEVRGADFAGVPDNIAGQGTSVELKMPDGGRHIYHILGEWDSDEKLGIISCRSKLAGALSGHRAGDAVEIPGENSPVSCVIEAVRGLPPEIREWINGA